MSIGPLELMVILLLALVVVGPSRLPEVGRSIGKALRELRKVQDEVRDSINFNLDEPIRPPKPTPTPRAARTAEPPASDLDDATWRPPPG
ncbi:MAG: twin-arginine translocase TatA/TatE family subunit, partial [Actinobacteria bacterium]|nr:twin-arginine translocase TatA/TatE family subunit [Actinomycetota bacterium]